MIVVPAPIGRDRALAVALPIESLQHPLSVYESLLEVRGMSLQHRRIAQLCEQLKLPAIHAEWSALAQRAAHEESSFADFLERVLERRAGGPHRTRPPDAAEARDAAGGEDARELRLQLRHRRAEGADPGTRRA